jgi:hypothetical protein
MATGNDGKFLIFKQGSFVLFEYALPKLIKKTSLDITLLIISHKRHVSAFKPSSD